MGARELEVDDHCVESLGVEETLGFTQVGGLVDLDSVEAETDGQGPPEVRLTVQKQNSHEQTKTVEPRHFPAQTMPSSKRERGGTRAIAERLLGIRLREASRDEGKWASGASLRAMTKRPDGLAEGK